MGFGETPSGRPQGMGLSGSPLPWPQGWFRGWKLWETVVTQAILVHRKQMGVSVMVTVDSDALHPLVP